SLSEWMNVPYLQYIYTKKPPKRVGLSHPSIVPYGCFITKDKKNILFSIQNEREWFAFSKKIIKIPENLEKSFKSPSLRLKNKNRLNEFIIKIFKLIDSNTLIRLFKKHKIAFGLLNSIKEFSSHPQLKKAYVEKNNKNFEFIPPVTLDDKKKFNKIPELGEHTLKIIKEFKK
ncbi:MAG: carnitine dehydratase, partial [Rickettsiales bacterium]